MIERNVVVRAMLLTGCSCSRSLELKIGPIRNPCQYDRLIKIRSAAAPRPAPRLARSAMYLDRRMAIASWGGITEALNKSDFVMTRRCKLKISPYISNIWSKDHECCVNIFCSRLVSFRTRTYSELPKFKNIDRIIHRALYSQEYNNRLK